MPPVSGTEVVVGSLKAQPPFLLSWSLQPELEGGRKWTIPQAADSKGEQVCEEKRGASGIRVFWLA